MIARFCLTYFILPETSTCFIIYICKYILRDSRVMRFTHLRLIFLENGAVIRTFLAITNSHSNKSTVLEKPSFVSVPLADLISSSLLSAFLCVPIRHLSYRWNNTARSFLWHLLSLSIMYWPLPSFVCFAKWDSVVWIPYLLLIISSFNRHFSSFYFLITLNKLLEYLYTELTWCMFPSIMKMKLLGHVPLKYW